MRYEDAIFDENQSSVLRGTHELVGNSTALRAVLEQIHAVAPTDSTVLIQGETGTGKELIARAIHRSSSRSDRPFVTLNCAAVPGTLMESELFGHERGAFTGAATQRMGRFEMADGGTLFLDEVGEVAVELQAKMLRVLQEQQFERVGGNKSTRVNVRVVAATNRDLEQMMGAKQFRSDLFYRLNVFPLSLPPLRDRAEDIPLLARHFLSKCATRMGKDVSSLSTETVEAMLSYDWPGNIRELQNFIERGVILSQGHVFQQPTVLSPAKSIEVQKCRKTLEQAMREHILQALEQTRWVVGGRSGTAAYLGIPRTTLIAKMRRLGIEHESAGMESWSGGSQPSVASMA